MIKDAVKFVLGLRDDDCQIFEQLLNKLGKVQQVEQHIQQLPQDVIQHIMNNAHDGTDGVIDNPEDPDNTDLAQYYNKHNTDGWNPEQNRQNSQIQQKLLPNTTSASDYPVPKQNSMSESHKPSFLQYILEDYPQQPQQNSNNMQQSGQPQQNSQQINTPAQIDAQLANIGGDGKTRVIDPVIQKQIDTLDAAGNHIAADQLRQRALRTAKVVAATGPQTPADALVASRKKQLSQAILAAQQQKQAAQVQQIQHPTNQQNANNMQNNQQPNQQGNPNAIR